MTTKAAMEEAAKVNQKCLPLAIPISISGLHSPMVDRRQRAPSAPLMQTSASRRYKEAHSRSSAVERFATTAYHPMGL